MELIATVVAIVGLAVGAYQTYRVRSVRQIVKDWGGDILNRLSQTSTSSKKLQAHLQKKDPVSWGQSRADIEFALEEHARIMNEITESMGTFLKNVVGGTG